MLMRTQLAPHPMADWTQAYMLWFRGFVDALGGARPTEEQWRAVLDRLQSYPPAGFAPSVSPVPYTDPLAGADLVQRYAADINAHAGRRYAEAAQQFQQAGKAA